MAEKLKAKEIADRISAHLKRFENEQSKSKPTLYWHSRAYGDRAHVYITYVSYQGNTIIKRSEAQKYLEWLDAGNKGRHYEWNRRADNG